MRDVPTPGRAATACGETRGPDGATRAGGARRTGSSRRQPPARTRPGSREARHARRAASRRVPNPSHSRVQRASTVGTQVGATAVRACRICPTIRLCPRSVVRAWRPDAHVPPASGSGAPRPGRGGLDAAVSYVPVTSERRQPGSRQALAWDGGPCFGTVPRGNSRTYTCMRGPRGHDRIALCVRTPRNRIAARRMRHVRRGEHHN